MSKHVAALIYNLALLLLVGFVFYLTRSWWTLLLLMFLSTEQERTGEND